jgi:hypothetical protein
LFLVQCGVPYEVALRLEEAERLAYVVLFGELRGYRFDWRRLAWDVGG